MEWNDLLTALALVFVLEGLGPAISPKQIRRIYDSIHGLDDGQLRATGLVLMVAGAVLLYFVN